MSDTLDWIVRIAIRPKRPAIAPGREQISSKLLEKTNLMRACFIFALAMVIANGTFAKQVLYCSGTVYYPSGVPAPGVRVEYYPGHHQGAGHYAEVKTDANGRYAIIGPEDTADYWGTIIETNSIMARDVGGNLAAVQEFQGPEVDLILQPAITVSGSVKDVAGAPIVGAELDFQFLASRSYHRLEAQRTKVNELGQFSVSALPQGREYEVWFIAAEGYGSGGGKVRADDTRTNRYEFPAFVLERANLKIAGRVLDKAGKPLAGAEVYFAGKGQPMNSEDKWSQQPFCNTNTDVEGKFSFANVYDAPLRVYADYHDSNKFGISTHNDGGMAAQPGDTNIVIQLPAPY